MSMVQQAIEVGAPLHTVYEQLAALENYPRFMTGVERVTPIGGRQTHWVMDVEGQRREFDAQITELSPDERISWSATAGPLLAETITVRPMGETRTQVVAQLEADIASLMPSDRHGQATLNRRLKDDLNAFKSLIESGWMGTASKLGGASAKRLAGRSGSGAQRDPASPASVADRVRNKAQPGGGWGRASTSTGANPDLGTKPASASAPGTRDAADSDAVLAPGRRLGSHRPVSGGAAGTRRNPSGRSGSAPMGGRTPVQDGWGDGMINEEGRGSAHDN